EHRIDIFQDRAALVAELEREFPGMRKEIRRLYDSIDPAADIVDDFLRNGAGCGFSMHRASFLLKRLPSAIRRGMEFRAALEDLSTVPALKSFIGAQSVLLSHTDVKGSPPLSLARQLMPHSRDYFHPPGGKWLLIEAMKKKIRSAGGDTPAVSGIESLKTAEVFGVTVSGAEDAAEFRGNRLILSSGWKGLEKICKKDRILKKLAGCSERVADTTYPFTIHLGVHDRGIPDEMASFVTLVSSDEKPLTGSNLIFIETSIRGDTARAPHGRRAFSATVFLSHSPADLDDSRLRAVSERIMDRTHEFLPFLKESITYQNLEKSIELSRKSQDAVRRRYRVTGSYPIGISPVPHRNPGKRVSLCGGLLMAGIGFEGEVLSGIAAADSLSGGK
ncbi:MAG: hypothetical protein PHW43_11840, partial [Syntrophales bacterium]|nr:hypothetical protein [Syntrophales bacterium]